MTWRVAIETIVRRVLRAEQCFDGRVFHTFVRTRADEHGNGVDWWCDYCGELIRREPTAAEAAMTPGVSP